MFCVQPTAEEPAAAAEPAPPATDAAEPASDPEAGAKRKHDAEDETETPAAEVYGNFDIVFGRRHCF